MQNQFLYAFWCLVFWIPKVSNAQIVYQDSNIKIICFISQIEGNIYFQFENLSDSVIIINEKNISFEEKMQNEWIADLSLRSSRVSLSEPSSYTILSFKRLLPKTKYTAIGYDFPFPNDTSLFKLYMKIDYFIIPENTFLKDNIFAYKLESFIRRTRLKVVTFKGVLGLKRFETGTYCRLFTIN